MSATGAKHDRRAAKQAEQARISQIGDFKNRAGGIVTLPSGVTVKVRNPGGMQAFLQSGTIPNSLMSIIKEGMEKGSKPSADKYFKDGEIDPQLLAEMTIMLDQVALQCIVEPKFLPRLTQIDVDVWNAANPDDRVEDIEDLRREDQLYVDELPDEDKQFLFQWISGGVKDLETFRKQYVKELAAMEKESRAQANAFGITGANAG